MSKFVDSRLFSGELLDECGGCQYCGADADGESMICLIPKHGDKPRVVSLSRNRVLSLIEIVKSLTEGDHEHEQYPVKKEETRCLPLPL